MSIFETADLPSALTTEDLIRQHQRAVWRYLRLLGCDPSLADDLTQEAFLRLLRSPPRDVRAAATGRWLRTTALNLFRDSKRAPRAGVALDADLLEEHWSRQGESSGEDYVAALRDCLAKMPEQKRRAVVLRYQDGCSRPAVAAALGASEEACKSILRRARAWLHNCIDRTIRRKP